MANCITYFAPNVKGGSPLREALTKKYGNPDVAEGMYQEIMYGESSGDNSFFTFVTNKDRPLLYPNGEPHIEEVEQWLESINNYNQLNKTFNTNSYSSTTQEFLQTVDGFNFYLAREMQAVGATANDIDDESGVRFKNIMNRAFDATVKRLRDVAARGGSNAVSNTRLADAMESAKPMFFEAYNKYLITALGLDINDSSVLSDLIEESDTKETKDTAYSKAADEFDTRASAPKAIKFMIMQIPSKNTDGTNNVHNLTGLPAMVDYTDTFNKIQQELVDKPADINIYLQGLENLAPQIPGIQTMIDSLGGMNYQLSAEPKLLAKQQLVRTQFVNQFNKSKYDFKLFIIEDGKMKVVDSNSERAIDIVMKDWEARFLTSIADGNNSYENFMAIKDAKSISVSEQLQALGIPPMEGVSQEDLDAIFEYGGNNEAEFNDLYRAKFGKGANGRLRKIAKQFLETTGDVNDFQLFNAEGKLVYGISLNTYLSSFIKDLNYYRGNPDKIRELYPEIEEGFSTNSRWLNDIYQGAGIKIGNYDGFKNGSNSLSSGKLSEKDVLVQRLAGLLMEGKYPFIRSADRIKENYFEVVNGSGLLIDPADPRGEMFNYLFDHLEAETLAMMEDRDVAFFKKNNKNFRAFYVKGKSLLEKYDNFEDFQNDLMDNGKDSEIIGDFLDAMIEEIVQEELTFMRDYEVNEHMFDSPLYDVFQEFGGFESAVEVFALNMFVGNIEQFKLFVGDPAYYKSASDIFKRTSMFNSTKESARTDAEMNTYIQKLFPERGNNSEIRTITIEDVEIDPAQFSKEFDALLKEVFGDDVDKYYESYEGMNEGDAQAYMTYDEYKVANIRMGTWMPQDEKLYQRIKAGDLSVTGDIMRRATVKKYQYTGRMKMGAANIPAGRKFSVIPLIPGILPVGSSLEAMATQMEENNIGMAFFTSAAKFGYTTDENGDAHKMYDGAQFTLSPERVEILDYKYMGDQLKIHNNPKEKITASTQKRKIAMADFFAGGKLIESAQEIADDIKKYNELQDEIVSREFKKLLGVDLGQVVDVSQDIDDLVKRLQDQGLKQGYSTNELLGLNKLKRYPLVDILPNRQKVESLVTALLAKNVITNKRPGTSAAQVSDVGFEIKVDSKLESETNRHNLKFYRRSVTGGLLPMEIALPLPDNLVKYVAGKYGNGKLTVEALNAFNADIAEDNKAFEADPDNHKSLLTQLTTYIGFRIPNQASSSSDVAKVKYFSHPLLGGIVGVPKPIVAKTGSDFDIDKLNLYGPNIKLMYEGQGKIGNNILVENRVDKDSLIYYLEQNEIESDENFDDMSMSALNSLFISEVMAKEVKPEDDSWITSIKNLFQSRVQDANLPVDVQYINPKGKSTKALQNRLLEVEARITLSKANEKNLLRPLADNNIRKIVKHIRSLTDKNSNVDKIGDVFKNKKNVEKFIAFLSGKAGVGQTAVHITNHVLAQKSGLRMLRQNDYFERKNQDDAQWLDIGLVENEDGVYVSELLSELLTAYVDIAKDPYILDINAVQATANTVFMLIRQGLGLETVFNFVNQPIIKEYIKAKSENDSLSRVQDKLSSAKLINKVLADNGITADSKNFISTTMKKLDRGEAIDPPADNHYDTVMTKKMLADQIKNGGANKKLAAQTLDLFLEYQRQSSKVQEMIRATSPDTQGFKNVSVLDMQVRLREKVEESGMFDNIDKMYNESFIGSYWKAKNGYFQSVRNLFISQRPHYKPQLDKFKEDATSQIFDGKKKEKILIDIDNDFISYLLARKGITKGKEQYDSLFRGSNSIPHAIQRIKDGGFDNYFLNHLTPIFDKKNNLHNLKLSTRKFTEMETEKMISSFAQLADPAVDAYLSEKFGVKGLFPALLMFQLHQSGISNSAYSYHNFIPIDMYVDIIGPAIKSSADSGITINEFVETQPAHMSGYSQFILNNPGYFAGRSKNLNIRIRWNKVKNKYVITYANKQAYQLGQGVKGKLYGSVPEFTYAPDNTAPETQAQEAKFREALSLSKKEVDNINPELEKTLTDLLNDLGVDVKYVNRITDANGQPLSAYGKAKVFQGIVEVANDKRDVTTLPEEAAHMITSLLGADHPIMKQMMSSVTYFPQYDEVKQAYAGKPGYETEEDFRFEAVGKVLADVIVSQSTQIPTGSGQRAVENWWERVKRVLRRLFNGKDLAKLNKEIEVFENFANAIINNKIQNMNEMRSEVGSRKAITDLVRRYNMKENGFFPDNINPDLFMQDLRREGLSDVYGIKQSRNGGYYLTRSNKKWNPFKSFMQLAPVTQESLAKQFIENDRKLSPEKYKSQDDYGLPVEQYVYDGKVVEHRPSSKQDKLFRQNKTKEEVIEIATSKKSEMAREVGTEGHNVAEAYLLAEAASDKFSNLGLGANQVAPTQTPKLQRLSVQQNNVIANSVKELAASISELQTKIDPNGKAQIYTERFVIDPSRDIAGSMDVFVVYSDGSVGIYDYKFINFFKDGKKSVDPKTSISVIKEKSYSLQISEYKKILKKEYGVEHIRESRIMPFNVQYKYNRQTGNPIGLKSIEGFSKDSKKNYLIPLPVAKEMTSNKKLDKVLSTLFNKEEKLARKIQETWKTKDENLREKLIVDRAAVKESIQKLQVLGSVEPLVNTMNIILTHSKQLSDRYEVEGKTKEEIDDMLSNVGDLTEMIAEVSAFETMFQNFADEIKSDSDKATLAMNITTVKAVLNDKLRDLLASQNGEITSEQRELSMLKSWTASMSKVNQPVFTEGWKLVKQSNGNIIRDTMDFAKELKVERDALKDWAKQNGMSLMDAYRKLMNEDKNLIAKFSSDMIKAEKEARKNGNVKWFKDNYEYTEEGKKKYEKAAKEYESHVRKTLGDGKIADARIAQWKTKYNLENDSAWLNKNAIFAYTETKNEETYYSKEYKALPDGLKRYYDFYYETNKKFNAMVEDEIKGNFVANIHKDTIDSLAQGDKLGDVFKSTWQDLESGLRMRQNDEFMKFGEMDERIPLLYHDNFMYKKGEKYEMSLQKKNEDLSNNMLLFAEAVYRKHYMTQIRQHIDALSMYVGQQKVIKTHNGRPVLDEAGNMIYIDSSVNKDTFDSMVKALVYGNRTQNEDTAITIKGRDYSTNKALAQVMSYMSTKSLAFNYVSGFGNAVAGYGNAYIKGVSGKYYTNTHMWNAHKMFAKRDERFLHLADYFKVEKDHWVKEEAANLSASQLTKQLRFDRFYLLQQKGDEFIGNTVLISMMQNYGLTEDGKIEKLSKLPEGSKSLLDLTSIKDDKINIEGLTNEAFDDFRNRVRYIARQVKGTTTREDISRIQTTILGKSVMHFRSWIAPMVEERFGGIKYTEEIKEWEAGRYRVLASEFALEGLLKRAASIVVDIASLGKIKYKGDTQLLDRQYAKFLEKNPDMVGKLSKEDYVELRMTALREALAEARVVTGFIILIAAARTDWDDDGIADYKQTKLSRELFKLVYRANLEFTFFANPMSTEELLKKPVPMMQVFTDFAGLGINTIDEAGDAIFGTEDKNDRTDVGHYSKKMVPLMNQVWRFMEDLNDE